ncbi:chemotaxis protein CheW [Insolitispirillum peregrinum]
MSDLAVVYDDQQEDRQDEMLSVLSLTLGGGLFAIETAQVLEVLDDTPLVMVPNSRPFVRGLLNMRGKVVPVVDLQRLLGMPHGGTVADPLERRIVVLTLMAHGEQALVGVLADRVHQVTSLSQTETETIPSVGVGWDVSLIKTIGKDHGAFIIVLDMEKIILPLVA